jgi:hypothetical protein
MGARRHQGVPAVAQEHRDEVGRALTTELVEPV